MILIALMLFAGPVETPPAAKPTPPARTKMVCRREVRPNSRFETKVCRTPEQMAESERAAEAYAREAFNKPSRAPDEGP